MSPHLSGAGRSCAAALLRRTVALALSLLLAAVASAAPRRGPDPQLWARARSEGTVRVLVRLAGVGAGVVRGPAAVRRRAFARARGGLMRELERAGAAPAHLRAFRHVPWLALEATPEMLDALASSGRVAAVEEDRLFEPTLQQSIPLIGADSAHADGIDGTGTAVAIIDTGVDSSHPFLQGRVVSEACYSANGSCPGGVTELLGEGSATFCTWESGCFHGTHVAGIAAGSASNIVGVAPAASIVAIRVFSRFSGRSCSGTGVNPCALAYTSDIVAGLEHVLDLAATLPVAAANLSLGSGGWTSTASCDANNGAFKAAIDALREAGIATVAASGNSGYLDRLSAPACISSAVSVGATDDSDVVASFSNSADFLSLLAPGVSITSSVPPALLGYSWGTASGTSMAAPHVAGTWALMKQVNPDASVDEVLATLQDTGVPILDPDNGVVTPRIDVYAAVQELAAATPLPEPEGGLPAGLALLAVLGWHRRKRAVGERSPNGRAGRLAESAC